MRTANIDMNERTTEELLTLYHQEKSNALQEEILQRFVPMAVKLSRRYCNANVEYDDLYQMAMIALLKAIERFDVSRGLKFSTFAMPTMVGEIKNYLRDHSDVIRLPRTDNEVFMRMKRICNEYSLRSGKSLSAVELAQELGISLERTLEIMELDRHRLISIDSIDEEHDGAENWIGEEEEGYELVERRELLDKMLEQLEPDDQQILIQRYLHGKTQAQVSRSLGVTQMYISRRERRLLAQLRVMFSETK